MTEAIAADGLIKRYGTVEAVRGISFSVPDGAIFAFLGPNGAGKTTTIKLLTGLTAPDGGTVRYHGELFTQNSVQVKSAIGIVPQHNNVDRDLTVKQNLTVHGLLFGLRGRELSSRIDEMLDFAGLSSQSAKKAGDLSGGMKRRLVIARALLHRPGILFLDEPTTGLDPATRRHIWDFIRKINRTAGCTVFLTTHYIEEADLLSHQVTFIDRGQIVASGTPEELKKNVGTYALERFLDDRIEETFFATREEALASLQASPVSAKIREVNLEDAYLSITGRRIET